MFSPNQTNNNNRPSVNTFMESFYGDMAYLQVGMWDDKISLKWTPCVGRMDNGRRQYDKDNATMSALSHAKVAALIKSYERVLQQKVDAREDPGEDGLCVGIPITAGGNNGGTNGIFIEYKRGEHGPDVYFTIAKGLTDTGAASICRHKFEHIGTLAGTTPEKGGYTSEYNEGDFYWFLDILKARVGLMRYSVHAERVAAQFATRNGNNNQQPASNNFDVSAMNSPMQDMGDIGFNVFN